MQCKHRNSRCMETSSEFLSPDIYYALACFTNVLTGIFCSVVRWCHMCRPYESRGDFFYPVRRQVSLFFILIALQFPYVLHPSDACCWFFVRSFGVIYYPICIAMLLHGYFRVGQTGKRIRLHYFLPIFLIGVLMLLFFACWDTLVVRYPVWIQCVTGIVSLLLSVGLIRECWWLGRRIDEYHAQNFSNESDFPYAFARKVIYQPILWVLVMWVVFLSDSKAVKMVVDLLSSVWMLFFLCLILHPNRKFHSEKAKEDFEMMKRASMEAIRAEEEEYEQGAMLEESIDDAKNAKLSLRKRFSAEDLEVAKDEVLSIVSRRYLEPGLKRVEVVRDVRKSTQALAGAFITQVGFYRLVNAFRIQHYERLMRSSSSIVNQDVAAERCGFKNRWALSNARKRMENFDYTLIEEYL